MVSKRALNIIDLKLLSIYAIIIIESNSATHRKVVDDNHMSKYKKCMIISIIFYICTCTSVFFLVRGDISSYWIPRSCFYAGMIGIVIGTCSLDISVLKKVIYAILQCIGYFFLVVIWLVILFIFQVGF